MAARGVTERAVDVGEVTLQVSEAGAGRLVVLVHGFPDGAYTWRRQLPALAAAGFHAVAPDLRGYGGSSRPRGVAAYAMSRIEDDLVGLIRSYGVDRAAIVGHDFGGGIAWSFAMHHPERVARLAILNAPHAVAFARGLRSPRQLARSWYMFAFQLPELPERLLRRNDLRAIRAVYMRDPVSRDAFSTADIERHIAALRPAGALTAAVNYYRALFRDARALIAATRVIRRPVLVLWGERDRYLGPELAAPDPRWVPDCRVVRIPDASHWVHLDAPDLVNAELIRFLTP